MKKKQEHKKEDFLDQLGKAQSLLGTVIDTRWFVEEYYPAHDDWDDRWWPERHIASSPYFTSEENARKFLEEHEPSEEYYKPNKTYTSVPCGLGTKESCNEPCGSGTGDCNTRSSRSY